MTKLDNFEDETNYVASNESIETVGIEANRNAKLRIKGAQRRNGIAIHQPLIQIKTPVLLQNFEDQLVCLRREYTMLTAQHR